MALLALRCHITTCRKGLAQIDPAEIGDAETILIPPCPVHHVGRTPWRASGSRRPNLDGVKFLRPGVFEVTIGIRVAVADLRPYIELAQRKRQAINVPIPLTRSAVH